MTNYQQANKSHHFLCDFRLLQLQVCCRTRIALILVCGSTLLPLSQVMIYLYVFSLQSDSILSSVLLFVVYPAHVYREVWKPAARIPFLAHPAWPTAARDLGIDFVFCKGDATYTYAYCMTWQNPDLICCVRFGVCGVCGLSPWTWDQMDSNPGNQEYVPPIFYTVPKLVSSTSTFHPGSFHFHLDSDD